MEHFQQVVEAGPFRFVVRNTTNNMLTFLLWASVWDVPEKDREWAWKQNFLMAASHTVEYEGLGDIKLPTRQATKKDLETAYRAVMDLIPYEIMKEWHNAADATHNAPANVVEKRDRDLSEEEAADPN